MQPSYLDQYSYLDSPLHRAPAGPKLGVALLLVFLAAMFPLSWTWFFVPLGAAIVVAAMVSRVPLKFLAKKLLLMELLFLGVALMRLFGPDGIRGFLSLVVGATYCGAIMLLVAATTRFTEMLAAMQRVGLPQILVTTLALMYRYLFVLIDESQRMQRARTARTYQPQRRRVWTLLSSVVAQLFVRAMERAQRIHAAMLARGLE
jgi:cobalt/nickel transport system permease protein